MTDKPNPIRSPSGEVQDKATTGGGEGDPAASLSAIEAYMDGEVSQLGTLHTTEATIPVGATERYRVFDNADELQDYLQTGGLTFFDSAGEPIPCHFVHILKMVDSADPDYFQYICFISEDSQETL